MSRFTCSPTRGVLGHDEDAVGDLQRLVQFGDQHQGRALGRGLAQLVADVASGGRCRRPGTARPGSGSFDGCASQRATTTFCWLPPDSVPIRSVRPLADDAERPDLALRRPPLLRSVDQTEPTENRGRNGSVMLRVIEKSGITALLPRSLADRKTPSANRVAGADRGVGPPLQPHDPGRRPAQPVEASRQRRSCRCRPGR